MAKKPVRKRLKHVKKSRKKSCGSTECTYQRTLSATSTVNDSMQISVSGVSGNINDCSNDGPNVKVVDIHFHDYCKPPAAQNEVVIEEPVETSETLPSSSMISSDVPELSLLNELKQKIDLFLYSNWFSVLEKNGISILLLSRDKPRVTQRSLFFHYDGSVEITVHCNAVNSEMYVKNAPVPLPLNDDSVNYFVDRVAFVVGNVRLMEVCAGVDSERFECVWKYCVGGQVDKNPYRETRYVETFRSLQCKFFVNSRTWRCPQCTKMLRPLRRRLESAKRVVKPNTPNTFLTEEQLLEKVSSQRKELDAAKKKVKYLQRKIGDLVDKEGVQVDADLSDSLTSILKSHDLAPAQEIFLHQQVKAAQLKKKCGMRWHPTMIRFALSIHLSSPAAYEELRATGMIKLPCRRTLFDYTHVKPIVEGVDNLVLESLIKRVAPLEKFKKYHVLMADEMHISKNLVFQKSSGKLIGFTSLDEADKEVKAMNEYLDDPSNNIIPNPDVASKVMCYMIKGVANGFKEVVATYAVANISPNQMYLWTWHVISALECGGIKVVAFICDGSSTNRAFINMHTPKTKLASGLVIDTINKAAPNRILYFISDVSHLLKTIRNCFYKSRADPKRGKRCLRRRGKKIIWDYIIRLYKETKNQSLRKAYKLSPVNVFPDSYSCMKVCYAAQVMSLTVATELKLRKYAGVSETVRFLTEVNNWFDRLNGAHTLMGKKRNNVNLYPYTSIDDPRFEGLLDFVHYLDEWKDEAYGNVSMNFTQNQSVLNKSADSALSQLSEEEVSLNLIEDDDCDTEEDTTPAARRILSHQTLKGIEMTTRSFIECVKFLLSEGVNFVNARIFSQDPLEQHFSKQRMGGGGSTNPNVYKVLWKNRAIHLKGQLGMKRPRGNTTEIEGSHVEVTEERLGKRLKKDCGLGLFMN